MTDVHIFQLLGSVYLAMGLSALINPRYFKKLCLDFFDTPSALCLGAMMALTIGFLLVVFHNNWTIGWQILITLVGWAALLKGMFLLIFPEFAASIMQALNRFQWWPKAIGGWVTFLGLLFVTASVL